jgi:Melibiase
MLPDGLVRARATLTNRGEPYGLDDLVLAFPVPSQAAEVLDLAEIKAAHPGLEIESCSSGGARVDLGVPEWRGLLSWADDWWYGNGSDMTPHRMSERAFARIMGKHSKEIQIAATEVERTSGVAQA